MVADAKDLLTRFEFLATERAKWEPVWKDISQVLLPRRSWWDNDDSSGKTPDVKLYDSTGIEALQTLADGLQGYAISPSFKFFKLRMADDDSNRLPFVADWLEVIESIIYSEFNSSNFYGAIGEFFLDAAALGTACIFVEDDEEHNRINFSCRHPKEIFIAENRCGEVDTIYRKFKVPVRVVVQHFGKSAMHSTWQRIYENNPYERVTMLHSITPRNDGEGPGRKTKKFQSVYLDYDNKEILDEGGYDSMPYLVWRWNKNSDEVYGRGPGMDALPDILRINQMAKTLLMAGEMSVNPPLNIPMKMKGMERIVPKGYNYYDSMSGKIEPINLGMNFPFGYQEFIAQREIVQNKFFVNFFLLMESIQQRGSMTATEVMERQSEKAAVLGARIGRLNSECLSPLIDRVYSILEKRMMIPPAPDALAREGGSIDIEYMGPLAQAQRRFNQSQGIQATLQLMAAMIDIEGKANQGGSVSIDNFNLDEIAQAGGTSAGAPQRTIREAPEIEKLRADRAKAQAQQQQQAMAMQQQQLMAQNADQLNQPMKPGSMMDQVTGNSAGAQK